MNYSFFGRMEHFERDFSYVKSHATGISDTKPTIQKKNVSPKSSQGIKRAQELFKSIKPKTMRRLYEFYRLDFEAFGYATDGFFPAHVKESYSIDSWINKLKIT